MYIDMQKKGFRPILAIKLDQRLPRKDYFQGTVTVNTLLPFSAHRQFFLQLSLSLNANAVLLAQEPKTLGHRVFSCACLTYTLSYSVQMFLFPSVHYCGFNEIGRIDDFSPSATLRSQRPPLPCRSRNRQPDHFLSGFTCLTLLGKAGNGQPLCRNIWLNKEVSTVVRKA